jgi:DNA topoisomerase IA
MELEPITRETLQNLCAERIAQQRAADIKRFVQNVYHAVRIKASSGEEKKHVYDLNKNVLEFAPDIVKELQRLFMDCKVECIEITSLNKKTYQQEVTGGLIIVDWT